MRNNSTSVSVFRRLMRVYEERLPHLIEAKLKRELKGCKSLVELGCGTESPAVQLIRNMFAVGVDGFLPSLKANKKKGYFQDYILADLTYLPFKDNSFDCVASFDVLEHLAKAKAAKLIEDMEKAAKKKVIISTPNGPNLKVHLENDNRLQIHRSSWTAEEISQKGYDVFGIDGALKLRGEQAKATIKPALLGALLARFSDILVFRCPSAAFSLLCIKRKESFSVIGEDVVMSLNSFRSAETESKL